MNSTQLLGNLKRDPEIRLTKNDKAVAMFTVACTRKAVFNGKENEYTDFIPVVAWGNLAEACGNTLLKGNRVVVHGRISVRSYEGNDGQKKYRTEVVADFIGTSLLNGQKSGQNNHAASPKPARSGLRLDGP